MATETAPQPAPEVAQQRSLWAYAWLRLRRHRMAMFGLGIIILLLVAAVIGPALSPYDYSQQDLLNVSKPPNAQNWLGTDELGRDMLTRILYGARTALLVALISTGGSTLIGAILGGLSAYIGGWVDNLVMRLADIVLAFPNLLLAVVINATVRAPVADWLQRVYQSTGWEFLRNTVVIDFIIVFGALSLVNWPGQARLVRGQILTLREQDFVAAAQAIGSSTWRTTTRHLLPNALGPLVISVTVQFGGAMLAESSLSFLGLGIQPPGASWGSMISDNLLRWRTAPHLVAMPAAVLAVVVFAFNMLGDGLNDALNPRSSLKK